MTARPRALVTLDRPGAACVLVAALLLAAWASPARTQPRLPDLTQPVHDLANVIDPSSAARIDELSRALQRATGDVIVVVTVHSYRPEFGDIRDMAVKLFENNGRGIGERGKDNGVLVLVAVEDRRVWIEVGYGLEGAITDGFAGETARLHMTPAFRQGNYGAGLLAGVMRLASRIAEERNVNIGDLPRVSRERPRQEPVTLPLWAVLLLLVVLYLMMRAARDHSVRRSPYTRTRGGHVWGPTNWSGWGGGGSFGGGSFGGGFGGFGGGRSGGGGGGAGW